jgi:hypothetical protein
MAHVKMPCGWNCGAKLSASEFRYHWKTCPNRPDRIKKEVPIKRAKAPAQLVRETHYVPLDD